MSAASAKRPVMLMILDGWVGARGGREQRGSAGANAEFRPALGAASPHAFLKTSGLDVGLPPGADGQFRGRPSQSRRGTRRDAGPALINQAIEDGTLGQALASSGLVDALKSRAAAPASAGSGLARRRACPSGSCGGAGASPGRARDIRCASMSFTDGRDTPPRSAAGYVREFAAALPPQAVIVSLTGRYYHGPRQPLGACRRPRGAQSCWARARNSPTPPPRSRPPMPRA